MQILNFLQTYYYVPTNSKGWWGEYIVFGGDPANFGVLFQLRALSSEPVDGI